jgi:hypothetical protein
MPFDTRLLIEPVDGRVWSLAAPLHYRGERDRWYISDGFTTDLATVPRFLWSVIPPYGTGVTLAVVVHDYLIDVELPRKTITSRDVDGVMRRIMREEGASWLLRWTMWAGVRWGALVSSRRAFGRGFLRDSPAVLGMSILAAPVVLLALLPASISWMWSR